VEQIASESLFSSAGLFSTEEFSRAQNSSAVCGADFFMLVA
jgi:hypothetical protein